MRRRFAVTALCLCIILLQIAPSSHAIQTVVRVGFCSEMAPYQYVTADGTAEGLHLALLEKIVERSDLIAELIPYETTTEAMDALENGDIDMVLGVPHDQYKRYKVVFSDVVSTANLCLIAPKGVAENNNQKYLENSIIAVEYRLVNYNFFIHVGKNLMLQANQKATIEMLQLNAVNAVVANKDCALYYLEKAGLLDDYEILNNHIATLEYTFAIRNSDWYLIQAIETSLKELRTTGAYGQLYDEWIKSSGDVDYMRIIRIAGAIISLILVFGGFYLITNYRAKKQLTRLVQEQTAALSAANLELNQRTLQAEAESKLRNTILESSSAGMIMIAPDQSVEYMNTVAMKMAGVRSYQVGDYLNPETVPGRIVATHEVNDDGRTWKKYERTIKISENESRMSRHYRYSVHEATNINGEPSTLISIEDVTVQERERAAFFEREKNKTLNNLIAGIAHEIKNPLTAIRTSAEMMESKGNNEKFRAAFSLYIPQEIARITRLIDSLLDYARPSRSRIEPVALSDTIRAVCELAQMSAKGIDITLEIDHTKELMVIGDRDKIKQALFNIVINSIEAVRFKNDMQGNAHKIDISARELKDGVQIVICDDGIGMTNEEIEHCMEPFYSTKPAGTGIGLAYTKQYIEEIGGTLAIKSMKNQYTCVELRLPMNNHEEGKQ